MYVVPYWHSHKIYQGCVLFLKIARSKCLGKYTPNKTRAEPSFLWFIFPGTDSQRQWTSRTDGCARCTSYWSMVLPGMWLIPFFNYYFPFFFFPFFFFLEERERAVHCASCSMRLFSFPTEFIQSSYPDDEQSSSDLFLTPHPLSSSLSDRQESNATDRLTGQACVKVLGGGVEQC